MNDDLQFILVVITTILVLSLIGFVGVNAILKHQCIQRSNAMGLEYQYDFWTECLVKANNRWIDIDNYNEVGVK